MSRDTDVAATREELEAEVNRLTSLATDRKYMMEAYRSMLGPVGLKVAALWEAKRVHRVHHSWTPGGLELTGEERAAHILEWEDAPKTLMTSIDGHLTPSEAG